MTLALKVALIAVVAVLLYGALTTLLQPMHAVLGG